jgi:hypothetical protein
MGDYALGKRALGICDRSGFTYKLNDLVPQIKDGKDTGLRVHWSMLDPDQPQLWLGRFPVNDPQALKFSRPDQNLKAGRNAVWNWAPVGDRNSLSFLYGFSTQDSTQATGEVGTVTVVTT